MRKLAGLLFISFMLSAFAAAQEKQTVTVFFNNEKKNPNYIDCTAGYPVKREVQSKRPRVIIAIEELLKGVTKEEAKLGYTGLSKEQTKDILKSVKIKNNAAFLDLSDSILKLSFLTASCGSGWFATVDKTVLANSKAQRVYYSLEGSFQDFYEWVQSEVPEELKKKPVP